EDPVVAALLDGDELAVPKLVGQEVAPEGRICRTCGGVLEVAEARREDAGVGEAGGVGCFESEYQEDVEVVGDGKAFKAFPVGEERDLGVECGDGHNERAQAGVDEAKGVLAGNGGQRDFERVGNFGSVYRALVKNRVGRAYEDRVFGCRVIVDSQATLHARVDIELRHVAQLRVFANDVHHSRNCAVTAECNLDRKSVV